MIYPNNFRIVDVFHTTLSRLQAVLMAQLNRIHIIFIVSYFEKSDVRSNFIEHMWLNHNKSLVLILH